MKKLVIAATTVFALTGCSSMGETMMAGKTMTGHEHAHHNHSDHNSKVNYVCPAHSDAHVHAEYNPQSEIATLSITAKNLGLDHQKVMLKQAVSASGARYVNDLNPHTIYEWHTKGNDGILTITTPTGEYQIYCQVSTKAMH